MNSYDINSPDFKLNPFPTLKAMREAGPVVTVKLPIIGKMPVATTHEATTAILKGKDRFALDPKNAGRKTSVGLTWWMPRSLRILTKNMMISDEPDHRRLRGLVDKAFHRQNLESLRQQISALADSFLDKIPATGTFDFVKTVARPFPLAVICELLGIPEGDRSRLSSRVERLTTASSAPGMILAFSGIRKLLRYFTDHFAEVRKKPREGLISSLVHAEEEGDRLDTDELLAMVFLLFLAGHETTVHLLGGGLWTLEKYPDEKARLAADPSISGSAVDELLRHVSPVQFSKPRYPLEDMDFHGTPLKRGEPIMACLASANADPAVFKNPENLDLTRKPNPHVSFGGGIHFCLGFQLARMESELVFTKMNERYPNYRLAIPPDDVEWKKRLGMRALKSLPVSVE